MKVTYVGPHDAVVIPALDDLEVKRGETAEVPDDVAERMLEQPGNWRVAAGNRERGTGNRAAPPSPPPAA